MKLLFCSVCHDVLGLLGQQWRQCLCGASGGQYNKDFMTATVGGMARVFGVGNQFFEPLYLFLTPEKKREMRQKFYGQPDTDAWWGEYPGDVQIFRIDSPDGPRLRVRVRQIPGARTSVVEVEVVDRRSYTIDGKHDVKSVVVPANLNPRLRQTLKKESKPGGRKRC